MIGDKVYLGSEPYTIEQKIGSGGISNVYLASPLEGGESLAVKVLKTEEELRLQTEAMRRYDKRIADMKYECVRFLFLNEQEFLKGIPQCHQVRRQARQ